MKIGFYSQDDFLFFRLLPYYFDFMEIFTYLHNEENKLPE